MPDFGLEALPGLADIFGSLGTATAEAAPGLAEASPAFGEGLATIGTGIGETAPGLEAFTGTGTGLFGSTEGLLGTAAPLGQATGDISSLVGPGTTAMGSALDFMGAPTASAFNTSAVTPQAFNGTSSFGSASSNLPPSVANANASMPGQGTSVFDTGTKPIQGINSTGAPSAVPTANSASAISAPPGAAAPVDPTSALTGSATQATTQAAPQASTSIESLLGKLSPGNVANSAIDSVVKNPIGTGLGVLGLGYNLMQGQKQTANQKALTADANQATANSNQMVQQGQALQQYLTNGTLPPAYQQQVDQAIADAKTTAISNAAAQGLPTDPTQNTALAQTLAKIDSSRASMQAQVAQQLFSSGSSLISSGQNAANLSGNLFQALVQNDTAQAQNMGKAIATLASSLNGRSNANLGNIQISTG